MQEDNQAPLSTTPFITLNEPALYSITFMTANPNDEHPDGHMTNYVGVATSQERAVAQGIAQIEKTDPPLAELGRLYGGFKVVCVVKQSESYIRKEFAKLSPPRMFPPFEPLSEKQIGIVNAFLAHILATKDRTVFDVLRPFLTPYEIALIENSFPSDLAPLSSITPGKMKIDEAFYFKNDGATC